MSLVARQESGRAGSSASADARPVGGPDAPLAGAHRRSGYRGAGMCRRPASRLVLGPITPTLDAPAPGLRPARTRGGGGRLIVRSHPSLPQGHRPRQRRRAEPRRTCLSAPSLITSGLYLRGASPRLSGQRVFSHAQGRTCPQFPASVYTVRD